MDKKRRYRKVDRIGPGSGGKFPVTHISFRDLQHLNRISIMGIKLANVTSAEMKNKTISHMGTKGSHPRDSRRPPKVSRAGAFLRIEEPKLAEAMAGHA